MYLSTQVTGIYWRGEQEYVTGMELLKLDILTGTFFYKINGTQNVPCTMC